jgi:uncharacterized protein (DUF58 family)
LSNRFFLIAILIVVAFIVGSFFAFVFSLTKIVLLVFVILILVDFFMLWAKKEAITANRTLPERLSLNDLNTVKITIKNNYTFGVLFECREELPKQFQKRDFIITGKITPKETTDINYDLQPKTRGEYNFGVTNIFVRTPLQLVIRHYKSTPSCMRPVFPSFIQMRKYELLAISNRLEEIGIKKTRKLGHQMEFDHIRDYVIGDDPRSVNWKATARKNTLMVNHFQDENSQQVYSIINMGRTMKMPFDGMTLLDYSINASLVISNTALRKSDKAGILTFSDKIHSFIKAKKTSGQIKTILELLYNQKTDFNEPNLELLYATIRSKIKTRSLLILYTNYEGIPSLRSQLPILRQIAKKHLLLVVLFRNTEIEKVATNQAKETKDIYLETIVNKYLFDKEMMIKEMASFGIHGLLTTPQSLSINLINKYLEFKARQIL